VLRLEQPDVPPRVTAPTSVKSLILLSDSHKDLEKAPIEAVIKRISALASKR
jgi:hypothetical protein